MPLGGYRASSTVINKI